ncbi:MAG: sigma-70 family RNA polymerase sigma factor [Planctomycetes bacterium]|nr:sigma-70 family RNA polymerase sigma factor [Planctomycetota bacterium]
MDGPTVDDVRLAVRFPAAPSEAEGLLTDERLMMKYAATRDRGLFTELVRRYERELYNYLCRYLGDTHLAEDVFQTTFLQVHLKRDQYDGERRFRPWLYAIAYHQAIDAQRHARRRRMVSIDRSSAASELSGDTVKLADLLVTEGEDPAVQVVDREDGERVRRALQTLTDPMRSVVHLVYYQGLKYREAADILSIPVGTVKSRLNAAIARLTEYWNGKE